MTTTDEPTRRHRLLADLLPAVPAFLGFVPERSVVLISYDELVGDYGATTRVDLGLTRAGALRMDCRRHVRAAVALLRAQGCDQVIVVVVDDRSLSAATGALVECVQDSLRSRSSDEPDIDIVDLVFVPAIATDRRWVCRHGESGVVADPRCNPASLRAALAGRPVRSSRAELVDVVRERGLGIDGKRCLHALGDPTADRREELLSAMVSAVSRFGPCTGAAPTDEQVALLGGALLDCDVRDACMGLGLTAARDDAQHLFAELARRLRGTPRAAAASLVAASAYLAGDGPLTGIALDAALHADRSYRAARLLAAAFDQGLQPQELASVAETGLAIANRLRVPFPPVAERPLAG